MATAKIEIRIGQLHFSAEGEQDWVSSQMDKLVSEAGKLAQISREVSPPEPQNPKPNGPATATSAIGQPSSLANFLTSKNATVSQVAKFLATAGWLHLKGKQNLTTSDVAKALQENHQSRLGNPTECLNLNIKKGFCEKKDGVFFITSEGFTQLAIPLS